MSNRSRFLVAGAIVGTLALLLASCSESSNVPEGAGVGPNPNLPEPTSKLIPTVNIAAAKGWAGDAKPTAAADWR